MIAEPSARRATPRSQPCWCALSCVQPAVRRIVESGRHSCPRTVRVRRILPARLVRGSLGGRVLERGRVEVADGGGAARRPVPHHPSTVRHRRSRVAGVALRRDGCWSLRAVLDQRARRTLDCGQPTPRPGVAEQGGDAAVGRVGHGMGTGRGAERGAAAVVRRSGGADRRPRRTVCRATQPV